MGRKFEWNLVLHFYLVWSCVLSSTCLCFASQKRDIQVDIYLGPLILAKLYTRTFKPKVEGEREGGRMRVGEGEENVDKTPLIKE